MIRVNPSWPGSVPGPDQRVRTPSLVAHITCQRAWAGLSRFHRNPLLPTAPHINQRRCLGQGLSVEKRMHSPPLKPPPHTPGSSQTRPSGSPKRYRKCRGLSTVGTHGDQLGLRRPATPPRHLGAAPGHSPDSTGSTPPFSGGTTTPGARMASLRDRNSNNAPEGTQVDLSPGLHARPLLSPERCRSGRFAHHGGASTRGNTREQPIRASKRPPPTSRSLGELATARRGWCRLSGYCGWA